MKFIKDIIIKYPMLTVVVWFAVIAFISLQIH